VRLSIRPCPLSAAHARSILPSRHAAWRGGKADLGHGDSGRDVGPECRLVLLDGQDVVPTPLDDFGADVAVREPGVAGDDPVLHRQHPQQFQRGLVFVGLSVPPQVGPNGSDIQGISGDQVNPRRLAVTTAAGGLAVEGEVRGVLRIEPPWNPLSETRLEVRDVDAPEDPRVGSLAEAASPGKSQETEELPAPLLAVIDEGLGAGHAREQGDDSPREQRGKGMALAPGTTRIIDAFKEFHQGRMSVHA
jgi:hypothetical protein